MSQLDDTFDGFGKNNKEPQVEEIEEEHVPLLTDGRHIGLVHKLGGNAGYVAEEDEKKEGEAFALRGSRFVGFDHVQRPRGTEADDHDNFKNFGHDGFPFNFYIINSF